MRTLIGCPHGFCQLLSGCGKRWAASFWNKLNRTQTGRAPGHKELTSRRAATHDAAARGPIPRSAELTAMLHAAGTMTTKTNNLWDATPESIQTPRLIEVGMYAQPTKHLRAVPLGQA